MIENIGLFLLGLLLLYGGAELLVRGSSSLALLIRIPPLIIGLTIVAFGTSFPEFVISMIAAWQDKINMAIGNIVGSNIANIGLILGVSGLILPIAVNPKSLQNELYWMLAASIVFWIFSLGGVINHLEGVILFSGIIIFTLLLIRSSLRFRQDSDQKQDTKVKFSRLNSRPVFLRFTIYIVMTISGIVFLMFGSHWLITTAAFIARRFGVSEIVIGLSLVAFGTSLPELATALISIVKKEHEILLGNVIGSNIFNLLFVGGILSSFFSAPIQNRVIYIDIPVMLAISILLFPIIHRSKKISRISGFSLIILYCIYIVFIFMGN